jgi:putative nucleotidyltransferase with HDIG domain
MSVIRQRATAGPLMGLMLSLAFGALLLPIATVDLFLYDGLPPPGRPAAVTLHTPQLSGSPSGGPSGILVPRGQPIDPDSYPVLANYVRGRRPPGAALLFGLWLAYFLCGLMFTSYLRNFGYRGNLLRTQLGLLGALVGFVLCAKVILLWTPLSVFYVPLALLAVPVAMHLDRQVAFATSVAGALLVGTLVPFDLMLSSVLLVQGLAAVLGVRSFKRRRGMIVAGLIGGLAAAGMYVIVDFLVSGRLPTGDLFTLASSGFWGCILGGLGGGLAAYLLAEPVEVLLGTVSRARLYELADLENPLLKKIAREAPGTWAHSLAMANLAEIAANAIGANALLTRVGAYYHDLGKVAQPRYYIENLHPGEQSPHEELAPEDSACAIFSHCTEGVLMGRRAGLPEPVIDFMHMHHGNGLLEYFWVKAKEGGNPKGLEERDFRYPGVPPQTRETAILAICDAVEAASRTLRQPSDDKQIEQLVQRIVFGKLRLGQFDQSGLSVGDLRRISDALMEALKNAFHSRIEYQWQRDERAATAAAAAGQVASGDRQFVTGEIEVPKPGTAATPAPVTLASSPAPAAAAAGGGRSSADPLPAAASSTTRRNDPTQPIRLDSADAPRPWRRNGNGAGGSGTLDRAATPVPSAAVPQNEAGPPTSGKPPTR